MSSTKNFAAHLIFTAGPVQGFVAQARRTRDLWAGSWLLSHLAEAALKAAEDAEGIAIIPFRGPNAGKLTSLRTPVGGYPNRFEIGFPSLEKATRGGEQAVKAFQSRWQELSEKVWKKFISTAADAHGHGTQGIWDRQIKNFWELSWTVAETPAEAGRLAAARKGFRNSPCPREDGLKCSLMGSASEISGHYGRNSHNKRRAFWAEVRKKTGVFDLTEAECLSAVSLVKRLFPKVVPELEDQVNWPSTSFVAALPWLKGLQGEALQQAKEFAKSIHEVERSEKLSARQCGIEWADVDASIWYEDALARDEWGLGEKLPETKSLLRKVYDRAGSKPLSFYALLVMDGDSLGTLLSKLDDPAELSRALGQFSSDVEKIVKEHNGWTIYAGGDDVLALLPAQHALSAAETLARRYGECFKNSPAGEDATLSGALLYVPLKAPLRPLIQTGHDILDRIAKERTGRDSLAIAIVLGSGLSALWSAPWRVVRNGFRGDSGLGLNASLHRFGSSDTDREKLPNYNASFLYGMREDLAKLFTRPTVEPGEFNDINLEEGELITDLIHSEYRRRLSKLQAQQTDFKESRAKIRNELVWLSQRSERNAEKAIEFDRKKFGFDGWRVARFLQQIQEGEVTI